jgi:hypothetical protein
MTPEEFGRRVMELIAEAQQAGVAIEDIVIELRAALEVVEDL